MKRKKISEILKKSIKPTMAISLLVATCAGAVHLNEEKNVEIINELQGEVSECVSTIDNLEEDSEKLRLANEELRGINSSLTNDINNVIADNKKLADIAGTKGDIDKALKAEEVLIEVSAYYTGEPGVGVITASGERVEIGHIAAPPEIPFGTKVLIEGFNRTYTVTDRGGYIKKIYNDSGEPVYRVDIYVNNHEEATRIGRRVVKGYFIYE